ncbi:hypothetical protein TKK_0002331 [Trichogramma kaykai]
MDTNKDVIRAKEEPGDTWTNACDDNVYKLGDHSKAEKIETFTFYKPSANYMNKAKILQEKLDDKIFIDCECKNVKPELTFLPMTVYKSEDQSYLPIVKEEN